MFKKIFNKKVIEKGNILLCIGQKVEKGRYEIPFIDNLVIYFVSDKNDTYKVLLEKDLEKLNISVDEILELSKENTIKKIFSIYKEIPFHINEEAEVMIPYDADVIIENGKYNFWTSMILISDFWDKDSALCINKKWNNYYIAMPYRTYLLIGNYDNKKSKIEINNQISSYINTPENELINDIEASKRIISNNIYVIKNGKIELE